MPPGAQAFPLALPAQGVVAEARISLDDLHKRMQQSEGNASSIERQLNDVRTHLKALRDQVTLDETNVQSIDLDSIAACLKSHADEHDPEHVLAADNPDREEVQLALEGVDADFTRLKHKVDEVQAELQISWMSLTTLQLQVEAKRGGCGAMLLGDQLGGKNRTLEQLSGSYERLRHAFIDKEEELRRERQLASNTLTALAVTHRDMDLKIESVNRELERLKALALQLRDWCSATEMMADEQCTQLKQLRADLASIASRLLHMIDWGDPAPKQEAHDDKLFQNVEEGCSAAATAGHGVAPLLEVQPPPPPPRGDMFQAMSNRLEVLVQELRSGRAEQDKMIDSLWSPPLCGDPSPRGEEVMNKGPNVGKRKLSEAFTVGQQQQQQQQQQLVGDEIADREKAFLWQKKAFLSGLRESFQRVRQREVACASLDRRLLKARLLLEQAQRGCMSSDSVSMKSKRHIEQAYKELVHVQRDIDNIKAVSLVERQELSTELVSDDHHPPRELSELLLCSSSSSPPPPPPQASTSSNAAQQQQFVSLCGGEVGRVKGELGRQVELNLKLKQQVAKLCLQAERAEGMVAVERLEVDKLRQQVQGISDRLKHEARCLHESHTAALRARDATIEQLRRQVERDETRKLLKAALDKNEELSVEREALVAKLGDQDLDLLKLRNENVCLVVEKIAFEGSARALQDKMANLMTKLAQTKQHWKRFVVYCQTF